MAKERKTVAVMESERRIHRSRAELDDRKAAESAAPVGAALKAPSWLTKDLRSEYKKLAGQLVELKIFGELDRDTLGQYLTARKAWLALTAKIAEAWEDDPDSVPGLVTMQDKFFKQCRSCAADLGLTMAARCRLIIPQSEPDEADDEMMSLLSGL